MATTASWAIPAVDPRDPLWRTTVTGEETERALDALLARYEHLGASVVSDDHALYRLLQSLGLTGADSDVGDYLCSFLHA